MLFYCCFLTYSGNYIIEVCCVCLLLLENVIGCVSGDATAQHTGRRLYNGIETADAFVGAIGVLATALANVLVVFGNDVAL